MTKEQMIIDICEILPGPLDEIYFQVLSKKNFNEVKDEWLKLFDPN